MFIKITAKEIGNLKMGDLVARYPMIGNAADTILMDDERQVHLMEIGKITDHHIDLRLSTHGVKGDVHSWNRAYPLSKSKKEIVDESRWWVSV